MQRTSAVLAFAVAVSLASGCGGIGGPAPGTDEPASVASVGVVLASGTTTVGQTTQATATLKDASGNVLTGRTVTWASSDPQVASVGSSGVVTALAAGSATVSASSEGKTGSAVLTVTPVPVATVTVSLARYALNVGETTQASAVLSDASGGILAGRSVTWASSDPAVASVDANGVVTALAFGSAAIDAACEGQRGSAALRVGPTTGVSLSLTTPSPTNEFVIAVDGGSYGTDPEVSSVTGLSMTSAWTEIGLAPGGPYRVRVLGVGVPDQVFPVMSASGMAEGVTVEDGSLTRVSVALATPSVEISAPTRAIASGPIRIDWTYTDPGAGLDRAGLDGRVCYDTSPLGGDLYGTQVYATGEKLSATRYRYTAEFSAPAAPGTIHFQVVAQTFDLGLPGIGRTGWYVDPSLARGESLLQIVPDVRVTVSPSTATVVAGATQTFTASVVGAPDAGVTWSVQEGDAGGQVSADGVYVAPDAPGTYHVVATSRADPTQGAVATVSVAPACWELLAVNRVRFVPRPGAAQAMVGGTIQGSNDGPTNGFVTLATVTATPAEGQFGELAFPNATPYRYVKYYGPPGSYGQIAELELYADDTRLSGQGFGTSGSRSGNAWPNALDGDPATFFDAPTASDAYVGLDLAAGHVVEEPRFAPPPGAYPAPLAVTIATATPGAAIRWSADGGDPRTGGTAYAEPVAVRPGRTVLRAAATASCMQPSEVAIGPYDVGGGGSPNQASLHVGNSLTDTIDGFLLPLAVAGGVNLDYSRYTVPGIGTWVYRQQPAGGFGVANVQTTVRTKRLDHISFQPFKNMPCLPSGGWTNPDARQRSDAANIEDAWNDAVAVNPSVQMWVYQAWPATPTEGFTGCITGGVGEWLRDSAIWNPPPPATWDDAVRNQAAFDEAVLAALAARHPDRPPPYILPAGLALLALKQAVEAGSFPGLAATSSAFWTTFFSNNGTNNHLTNEGRWYVALVFYAAMFQRDPAGLPRAGTALTDAQAAALQALAWQTVSDYALSGIRR